MRRLAVVSSALFALLLPGGAQAWTWPIDGLVLRPFVFGSDPYADGQHRGIDVGGALGESVRAPAPGVVSFAGSVPSGGRALTIRTADGYSVTLLQLGSIAVQRGEEVAEGARVGAVGESADAVTREPHVHLGVRRTAEEEGYLDPLGFLPGRTRVVVPAPAPAPAPAPVQPQPAPPVQRVEEPAQRPAAAAPQPEPPATAAPVIDPPTLTRSEEPTVAAAEPAGDAGGLEVVASGRPLVAAGLIVRAARGRVLLRDATDRAPTGSVVRPALKARRATAAKPSPRAADGPEPSDPAASAPGFVHTLQNTKLVTSVGSSAGAPRLRAWHAALALLILIAAALARIVVPRKQARIMATDELPDTEEGLGCSGVAVCVGPASHRPRGRVRRAVGCVRAIPPPARQRRADGQRHRRARYAGDGLVRPGGRNPT